MNRLAQHAKGLRHAFPAGTRRPRPRRDGTTRPTFQSASGVGVAAVAAAALLVVAACGGKNSSSKAGGPQNNDAKAAGTKSNVTIGLFNPTIGPFAALGTDVNAGFDAAVRGMTYGFTRGGSRRAAHRVRRAGHRHDEPLGTTRLRAWSVHASSGASATPIDNHGRPSAMTFGAVGSTMWHRCSRAAAFRELHQPAAGAAQSHRVPDRDQLDGVVPADPEERRSVVEQRVDQEVVRPVDLCHALVHGCGRRGCGSMLGSRDRSPARDAAARARRGSTSRAARRARWAARKPTSGGPARKAR